jgi:hypothetical protein
LDGRFLNFSVSLPCALAAVTGAAQHLQVVDGIGATLAKRQDVIHGEVLPTPAHRTDSVSQKGGSPLAVRGVVVRPTCRVLVAGLVLSLVVVFAQALVVREARTVRRKAGLLKHGHPR